MPGSGGTEQGIRRDIAGGREGEAHAIGGLAVSFTPGDEGLALVEA
jgi:hypothetical protein